MKRLLGYIPSVLLAATLVACGNGGDSAGDDPADSPPSTLPSDSAEPSDDGEILDQQIVSQTNVGGQVDERAVVLRSEADVDEFLAPFEPGQLTEGVRKAVDANDPQDDTALLGAVVAIGCDVPKEVELTQEGSGPVISLTPVKVKATTNQCLAPVTSIALVTVDDVLVAG